MQVTQVIVFTREELESIINGATWAFVLPGDNRETLIMTTEKYEEWRESESGFLD